MFVIVEVAKLSTFNRNIIFFFLMIKQIIEIKSYDKRVHH